MRKSWCLIAVLALTACEDGPGGDSPDGGEQVADSGTPDAGGPDAGPGDGGAQEGEAGHWSAHAVSGVGSLHGVWGSGARDVWAVGEAGFILHWDGERWSQETRMPAGFTSTLQDVWGSSAQDVWAVGQAGAILHFNGLEWQLVEVASPPFCSADLCLGGLRALWGSSATDVWAVGSSHQGQGVVSHWDGTRWSHAVQSGSGRFQGIWGRGATDVWAGGVSQLLHWNGRAWEVSATGTPTSSVPTSLWGAAANDVWGVNLAGELHHWDGTRWEEVSLAGEDVVPLRAIAGTGAASVWAIGGTTGSASRTVLHWDGTAWQRVRQETAPAMEDLWVLPDGEAWAVGGQGSLLHRLP